MAKFPETVTFNVQPKKPHITAIWILAIALLLSIGGNVWQNSVRRNDKIRADLDRANSNTLIAGKQGEISMRDSLITDIRHQRHNDSLKNSASLVALKQHVAVLQVRLEKLPKTVPYSPDSAMVDSLRIAFILKDSVIDTQALMILSLETEKTGIFDSFHKEISELQDQRAAQVDISNSLQVQLVAEQGETRKEKRGKKFWRFTAAVAGGVIAVLLLKP